jgi:hypothetical protein
MPSRLALLTLRCTRTIHTISDPKDIADAVIYLPEARNVTGEELHVYGGRARRPVVSARNSSERIALTLRAGPEPLGTMAAFRTFALEHARLLSSSPSEAVPSGSSSR